MVAEAPQILVDMGIAAGALTALVSLLILVSRLAPSRWLWRTVVGTPISSWFRHEVTEAVKSITTELVDPKIAVLSAQVETIAAQTAQLLPNEGSHLADAVNRTEAAATAIEKRLRGPLAE